MIGVYVGVLGTIAGLLLGHGWYALPTHLAASESPRIPRYTGAVVSHTGNLIVLETTRSMQKTTRVRIETDQSTQWFVLRYANADNGVRTNSQSLDIKPPYAIPPGVIIEVDSILTAHGDLKAKDISFYDPA